MLALIVGISIPVSKADAYYVRTFGYRPYGYYGYGYNPYYFYSYPFGYGNYFYRVVRPFWWW